jgi:hypothetical protein
MVAILMSEKDSTRGCTLDRARAAKPQALGKFKRMAKVVGIGIIKIGNGYGLKVNLQGAPNRKLSLPKKIKGVPVQIEVVGAIDKRSAV